ncbi:MAG: dephospho-CoA kinase [Bauldia sp.]
MRVIGITGTIASGKSTTAAMFGDEGVPVFSADATVHDLYRRKAVPAVGELFPSAVVDGEVDRRRLGTLLAADPSLVPRLEAIIHPLVRAEEEAFIARARAEGHPAVVIEHPLIFEKGERQRFDIVVATTAPAALREERALARPGMTRETYRLLSGRQLPDEEKQARADFVVDTGSGMDAARAAVRHILGRLAARRD